jgi:DNA repair photolyase
MDKNHPPNIVGRASTIAPLSRFERYQYEVDLSDFESDPDYLGSSRKVPTEYYRDESNSIVSENNSPDVGFRYSINPYRGCAHGCAYCYARPTHEYLGMNAGLDFESKIMVKEDAASLFRKWLSRKQWKPELIAFSGVTDCYQPAERQFKLTRSCLEVACEARQPIGIITKNALVTRDLDLIIEMAKFNAIRVSISVTTLDMDLARKMEPRTSTPRARLSAIQQLSNAGVPVNVMVAPIIPGLNDVEIASILKAAAEAGAQSAGSVLLRLPLSVRPVFLDWLERNLPSQKEKIEARIRSIRDGKLNDSTFKSRMKGSGPMAEQIKQSFNVFKKKFGLDKSSPPLSSEHFRIPQSDDGQLRLF